MHGSAIASRVAGVPALFLRVDGCRHRSSCTSTRASPRTTSSSCSNKNVPGAAISLGLSMLGFALPVASAVAHAADIVDCIDLERDRALVQVIVYYVARIPVPEPVAAHRGGRSRAGDLARARLGHRRAAERRLDDLVRRRMKRSSQVALVLMGVTGVGADGLRDDQAAHRTACRTGSPAATRSPRNPAGAPARACRRRRSGRRARLQRSGYSDADEQQSQQQRSGRGRSSRAPARRQRPRPRCRSPAVVDQHQHVGTTTTTTSRGGFGSTAAVVSLGLARGG